MSSWQSYNFGISLLLWVFASESVFVSILPCLLNSLNVCRASVEMLPGPMGTQHLQQEMLSKAQGLCSHHQLSPALTCASVLTHGATKPMGLAFLFLVQWLFRGMVSKCWGTKTEKVPNSNHMLQICLTFVIHFFLIFDARPSSEFLSTRSIRGSIMAICTMPFYRLFLEHNLKYSLSDKSSNILVISMYSFFLSFYNAN